MQGSSAPSNSRTPCRERLVRYLSGEGCNSPATRLSRLYQPLYILLMPEKALTLEESCMIRGSDKERPRRYRVPIIPRTSRRLPRGVVFLESPLRLKTWLPTTPSLSPSLGWFYSDQMMHVNLTTAAELTVSAVAFCGMAERCTP